jgi:hypothetical protein
MKIPLFGPKAKDIMITIPATTDWETEYAKEIAAAAAGEIMNYKIHNSPKFIDKTSRCYVTHKGVVKGWMQVLGLVYNNTFTCSTTGEEWEGNFIQRTGEFHPVKPAPMPGFRGFRYVDRSQFTDI